jgi:hypothetical protein
MENVICISADLTVDGVESSEMDFFRSSFLIESSQLGASLA